MDNRSKVITGSMLVAIVTSLSGCGGSHTLDNSTALEERVEIVPDSLAPANEPDKNASENKSSKPPVRRRYGGDHEFKSAATEESATQQNDAKAKKTDDSTGEDSTVRSSDVTTLSSHERRLYYGNVVSDDSAYAVDDLIWRQFDLAAEYHSMGVIANREAAWEEAQYYFDKALSILADLDIETDSTLTPEAVRYTTMLENLIADYQVTLRSLGELTDDVTPAVILERYGNLGSRLEADTLRVFSQDSKPISYDLPVKMNDRVKASIIYFQTVAKDAFYKYLSRKPRYEKLFSEVLLKHDMPQDFIYLSLVESGYNPSAYSWARAMGLWQFISSTGRMYGLKRDWWIDERKDPVKSTNAAARFLKDLYEKFGDWELAMAAYNGGPGRVGRTIKKQKTRDFWKMRLRRQTMDYVPLIYAAAIIAKNPEKYGFYNIELEEPVVWDEVNIDRALDLNVVAKALGTTLSELKRINPELLRNYTPPNRKHYLLKIPVGFKEQFLAAYPTMPSPKNTSWVKHRIKRGETVSTIAAKYGVSQYSILSSNNLNRRARIYAGKTIIVPVPLDGSSKRSGKKRKYNTDKSIYAVRTGDTMWDIARAFGTSVAALRRINTIERGSRIYVGQRLKIPSNARNLAKSKKTPSKVFANNPGASGSTGSSGTSVVPGSKKSYKVRAGDTLWEIARRFGMSTSKIRRLNGLGRSSRIYPGQILTIEGSEGPGYVIHRVRRGETLSRIAQKYRTTISRIQANNGLTNPDQLRVGTSLRIYR